MYQIRRQHRNEEARELIPSDYAGVMISDRGKGYDADEFEGVGQQKCWGHILRNIADVAETKLGRARDSRPENEFADKAGEIKELVSYHLRDRNLTDADNRLLDGLGAHDDRGHLLRLREAPFVEPANNRAERILRPAVIARKVSQCSKNQPGPEAFAIQKHRANGGQEWRGFGYIGLPGPIHRSERQAIRTVQRRYEFTLDGGKIEPQRDNPPVENMWTALSPLTIYSITR